MVFLLFLILLFIIFSVFIFFASIFNYTCLLVSIGKHFPAYDKSEQV